MTSKSDRFLSVKEAAEMIGLGESTLRHGKCGTGEIPRMRLGRRVMFSQKAIEAWMAKKVRECEALKQKQNQAARESDRRRQWLRLSIIRQEAIRRKNERLKRER